MQFFNTLARAGSEKLDIATSNLLKTLKRTFSG